MYYTKKTILSPTELVFNQTRSYLVQQLISYGDEFMKHIKNNNILFYGIQDYGIHKTEGSRKIKPNVYMLFDVNGAKKYGNYLNIHQGRYDFAKSLQYFQRHHSYKMDYCYDSNKNGHLHVVVLSLPHPEKFHYFMKGQYSKMYTEKEIMSWFGKYIEKKEGKSIIQYKTKQYCVLSHDKDYFPKFKDEVFEEFGTVLSDNEINMEYDFPPHLNNEILRYDI